MGLRSPQAGLYRKGTAAAVVGGPLLFLVAMAGLEAEIQDNAYFIVASTVLFLGGGAVAAALWTMSDEEYDSGTRHNSLRGA